MGDGQWDIPKLRELLEVIVSENTSFQDFRVEHNFPEIGPKIMLLNARRIPPVGERASLILLAIEDVTEVQKKEGECQETIARLQKELEEARGGIRKGGEAGASGTEGSEGESLGRGLEGL